MNRRTFLAASASAGAFKAWAAKSPIKKGLVFGMLPSSMSYADRFKLARDVGFEEVECYTTPDEKEVAEIKKASDATQVRIHSVMNQAHWKYPLSSADPAVVAESVKGMETSLRNANFWGADTVLLVPAVVNPETTYQDAWTRSQARNPQDDPDGPETQGGHRGRERLEQVPAQPPRVRALRGPVPAAPGCAPTSTSATWCCSDIRRTGSAP